MDFSLESKHQECNKFIDANFLRTVQFSFSENSVFGSQQSETLFFFTFLCHHAEIKCIWENYKQETRFRPDHPFPPKQNYINATNSSKCHTNQTKPILVHSVLHLRLCTIRICIAINRWMYSYSKHRLELINVVPVTAYVQTYAWCSSSYSENEMGLK